jgi:hypothetical protein
MVTLNCTSVHRPRHMADKLKYPTPCQRWQFSYVRWSRHRPMNLSLSDRPKNRPTNLTSLTNLYRFPIVGALMCDYRKTTNL